MAQTVQRLAAQWMAGVWLEEWTVLAALWLSQLVIWSMEEWWRGTNGERLRWASSSNGICRAWNSRRLPTTCARFSPACQTQTQSCSSAQDPSTSATACQGQGLCCQGHCCQDPVKGRCCQGWGPSTFSYQAAAFCWSSFCQDQIPQTRDAS